MGDGRRAAGNVGGELAYPYRHAAPCFFTAEIMRNFNDRWSCHFWSTRRPLDGSALPSGIVSDDPSSRGKFWSIAERRVLVLARSRGVRPQLTSVIHFVFGSRRPALLSNLQSDRSKVSVRPWACCAVRPCWRGRVDRSLLLDSIRRSGDGPDRGHHPHGTPP